MPWYAPRILQAKPKKLVLVTLATLIILGGSVAAVMLIRDQHQDDVLNAVFARIDSTEYYSQNVVTSTSLSDRTIVVEGIYQNNRKSSTYSSISSTTVQVPGVSRPIVFSLSNVSSDGVVFTRAESPDSELIATIPVGLGWRSFPEREIPAEYKGIAISGPVLDNLGIFSNKGSSVRLIKSFGEDAAFGEKLLRYQFELKLSLRENIGPLSAIFERVGTEGRVDIWVDGDAEEIRHIVFANPPYFSTTTISNINTPQVIDIPSL